MGIDRIGKGGPAGGAQPPVEISKTKQAERPFEVGRSERKEPSTHVAGAEATQAKTPLERLRAGEVDLPGYLDLQVEKATAHLAGLGPAQLDVIKKTLRAQLASDPALVDLVKQATGAAPPPADD